MTTAAMLLKGVAVPKRVRIVGQLRVYLPLPLPLPFRSLRA